MRFDRIYVVATACLVSAACIQSMREGDDVAAADGTDADGDAAEDAPTGDGGADIPAGDDGGPDTAEVRDDADAAAPVCGVDFECANSDDPCLEIVCAGGACVTRPATTGAACDDGNPCTEADHCEAGECVGQPVADGTECDNGVFCDGVDLCKGGVCMTDTPPPCDGQLREGACADGYTCDEEARTCHPVPPRAGDEIACLTPEAGLPGLCRADVCVPEGMAGIPAGESMMGCTLGPLCPTESRPLHRVRLPRFAVDLREATVGRWRACVDAGACEHTGQQDALAAFPDVMSDVAAAVPFLTYGQAGDLCAFEGKRLCTEAEWEKAARIDDPSGLNLLPYPWGADAPTCSRAHHRPLADATVCMPSGAARAADSGYDGASPYGLLNAAGNVKEWVADAWDAAAYEGRSWDDAVESPEVTDPNATSRILRGGSYKTEPTGLVVWLREEADPDTSANFVSAWDRGVRCCVAIRAEPSVSP